MANQVTDPRTQRELQRAFGLRGLQEPLSLSSQVVPVTLVQDLTELDVYSDAPYVRRFAGRRTVTGDATHPPLVWLENPLNSNTLVIVRKILIDHSAQRADVGIFSGAGLTPTTTGKGAAFNARLWPAFATAAQSAANVASATNIATQGYDSGIAYFSVSNVSTLLVDDLDIALPPPLFLNQPLYLLAQTPTNNTLLEVSFVWDEIPLSQT